MSTTKHTGAPVEGDGVSYSGIVWFVVILAITTIVCQVLMWVLLKAMQSQTPDAATVASPLAVAAPRQAEAGRVYPDMVAIGNQKGPAPALLVLEPENMAAYRAQEDAILKSYGWVDQNAGTIRIPIDKAKDLLLQKGLPTRTAGK